MSVLDKGQELDIKNPKELSDEGLANYYHYLQTQRELILIEVKSAEKRMLVLDGDLKSIAKKMPSRARDRGKPSRQKVRDIADLEEYSEIDAREYVHLEDPMPRYEARLRKVNALIVACELLIERKK